MATEFLQVIDDPHFPSSLYPQSFVAAIEIARSIVAQNEFLELLTDLFGDMDINCAKSMIEKGFSVRTIELKADLDAYACVYCGVPGQEANYTTMYFNPLLLLSARKLEATQEEVSSLGKRKYDAPSSSSQPKSDSKIRLTMFFVIKIIHEISHILNFHCNPIIQTKRKTPPKKLVKGAPAFENFGEMVELKLFGGVIEHSEERKINEKRAFSIQGIVLYKFSGDARGGRMINWTHDIFSITTNLPWAEIKKILTPIRGNKYMGLSTGNRKKLVLPISKASTAYSGEEDKEEEKEVEEEEEDDDDDEEEEDEDDDNDEEEEDEDDDNDDEEEEEEEKGEHDVQRKLYEGIGKA